MEKKERKRFEGMEIPLFGYLIAKREGGELKGKDLEG